MSVSTAMKIKVTSTQLTEMLNPCFNCGPPPSAAATNSSLNYYAKGLDIVAVAYIAQLKNRANPVSAHGVAAEMMNQSINSPAFITASSPLNILSLVHGQLSLFSSRIGR